ncbi:SCO3242 family prenyltransferase [Nonomuraea sp. KM90]|uniref:SCO3242 family prenyltransferase n=1 Tax=Nonomuraea sp. KM90 TaxID=3457428 RepID=UPI003FCCD7B1
MTALRDLLELVRAPAALSVPGDVVAGAAAGRALGGRTLGLACSSVCLYWAGMAANDWADRHLDAVERPERPIPSGRVPPGTALTLAAGLTVAGVAMAGLTGGRRALAVAVPLAAAVWTYDLVAKNTSAGPLAMAACRGLDVLLGATPGRHLAAALPSALTVSAHTYLLTDLSRGETSGTSRLRPAATLAATLAVATTAAPRPLTPGPLPATRHSPAPTPLPAPTGAPLFRALSQVAPSLLRGSRRSSGPGLRPEARHPSGPSHLPVTRRPVAGAVAQAGLAGWYAAQFGSPQARAVADPSAARVRAAVTAGIVSLPALQGALAARAGAPRIGLALAAVVPLARRLARKLSPT